MTYTSTDMQARIAAGLEEHVYNPIGKERLKILFGRQRAILMPDDWAVQEVIKIAEKIRSLLAKHDDSDVS